jgi:uncharacterized membrane protein (UPF0127 family)
MGLLHKILGRQTSDDAPLEVVRAINTTRDVVIATRVEWAGTSQLRRRGLLGRDKIGDDEGIYIVPTQWIHMFGMRFPIDVAYLAEDGRVLSVQAEIKPNRFSRPSWRAEGALEVAAGRLAATGTRVGDIIVLE